MLGVILGAGLAGAGYVLGTALHELSHVASVLATGGRVERVAWRQTVVEYEPSSEWADWLIKATPTLLTPVLVAAVGLSIETVPGMLFAVGLLGGFVPRDLTEYVAVGQLFVAGTET